jgi:hypothetical protein
VCMATYLQLAKKGAALKDYVYSSNENFQWLQSLFIYMDTPL